MKKILLLITAIVFLFASANAQWTKQLHETKLIEDSLTYLAGQATDTSEIYYVGDYVNFAFWGVTDENSGEDSSSIRWLFQVSPNGVIFTSIDTLDNDSTVASLPTTNYKDISATLTPTRYLRILTLNKNGTNDTSVVSNRLVGQK